MNFVIRPMQASDLDGLARIFSRLNKPRTQFEIFWEAHQAGQRVTFVAICETASVGYTNLLWQSAYASFQALDIPEINNMHILDEFQRQGIGTALIQAAEQTAAAHKKDVIGIGVGLTVNYSAAHQLYLKLGYLPDGCGVQPTPWGNVLYLTRKLV